MPATYTHAIYGEKVYQLCDDKMKALIDQYRGYYDIGLSGPDILFFYRPIGKDEKGISDIGNHMHELAAREFFMQARLKIKESSNPEAALAYILGFINHFVLDSECHPIINQYTSVNEVTHSELESELDALFMREKGLNPVKTRTTEHILAKKEYAEVIAPFFGLESKEVLEALKTMKLLLNIFIAPSALKRKFIYFVMKKVGVYQKYQGLIFNYEPRKDTIEICQVLKEKLENIKGESVRLMKEYQMSLDTNEALDQRYDLSYE